MYDESDWINPCWSCIGHLSLVAIVVNRTEYCTSCINSLYINSFASWLLTCNTSLLCCVQVFLVVCGKKKFISRGFSDIIGSGWIDPTAGFSGQIPRPGISWRALAVASRHSAPAFFDPRKPSRFPCCKGKKWWEGTTRGQLPHVSAGKSNLW